MFLQTKKIYQKVLVFFFFRDVDYKKLNVDLVILFFFFVIQQKLISSCIKTSYSHTYLIQQSASHINLHIETHGDCCVSPLFCSVVGILFKGQLSCGSRDQHHHRLISASCPQTPYRWPLQKVGKQLVYLYLCLPLDWDHLW